MAFVTAVAVAGVSTAASIHQGRKASSASKKANKAQAAINRKRNLQSKREFLRSFRQAQAATLTSSVVAGVDLESSAFQGTLSSERTQANLAVREFQEFDKLGAEIIKQQNKESSAQFKAGVASSLSSFALAFKD